VGEIGYSPKGATRGHGRGESQGKGKALLTGEGECLNRRTNEKTPISATQCPISGRKQGQHQSATNKGHDKGVQQVLKRRDRHGGGQGRGRKEIQRMKAHFYMDICSKRDFTSFLLAISSKTDPGEPGNRESKALRASVGVPKSSACGKKR